ncbi:glycine oxidase ThiO [Sandaracinus amylolyticus]|uniref:glycine oxidase ThiO n=1 Tax=Sandaracinus amylolyticus TaxID=927083 RepID=UPI001F01D745|nr:glycine oxidase ThiO [Sandaracinus amylolyticus]
MSSPDVVVIGGGVMGCAIALRLATRGLRPVVLERSVPGAEASSVAAGILAPRIEHGEPGVATRCGVRSRELHERLAEELRERAGVDVGFRRCGAMIVATDDEDRLESRARSLRDGGAAAEHLDADEARRREPELGPAVRGAIDLPEEAQVEPPVLLRALAIAAERAGARFRSGATVRGVRTEGARITGVLVDDGTIDAGHVVVAAGSWTALVPGLPAPAQVVRPIRGQLVHTERRPCIASRIVFGAGGYVVPRPDGRVVCGATMEDAGFAKEVTLGGVATVIARATRVFPALADAPLVSSAVNFRPASPDELPLVGPAGPEGLWLATGHHRNGILLAPLTAVLIAEMIAEGATSIPDAAALDPRRFARGTA